MDVRALAHPMSELTREQPAALDRKHAIDQRVEAICAVCVDKSVRREMLREWMGSAK